MASKREAHQVANEKELAWMLKPELLTALHCCAVITLTRAITSEYFLFRRGMSIEQVRKLLPGRQPGRPGPAAHLHHGRAAGGRPSPATGHPVCQSGLPHQAADVLRHGHQLWLPVLAVPPRADPRARDGTPVSTQQQFW